MSFREGIFYRFSLFFQNGSMKYYYEKPENWISAGRIYYCDAPTYNYCTLFRNGNVGLAVIQEHYSKDKKARWWGPVEPWISGELWRHKDFGKFLIDNSGEPNEKGVFPTIQLRKLMWRLRMKPLRKEFWEEGDFD